MLKLNTSDVENDGKLGLSAAGDGGRTGRGAVTIFYGFVVLSLMTSALLLSCI